MDAKTTQPPAVVYEDFEPFCKWQRSEDRDILEIELQDFRKDQLKVQISNHGILKISGERQVDQLKKSRFYKEVPASRNTYDTSAIQAKFVKPWLYITLPKRKQVPDSTGTQPPPAPEIPQIDQTQKQSPETPAAPKSDDKSKAVAPPPKEIEGGGIAYEARGQRRAVALAATVVALAVLVAYVLYIYKSTVGENDEA